MSNTFRLDAKISLVTGATGDIGSAIARSLAAQGSDVGLLYFGSPDKARRLAEELRGMGRQAFPLEQDLNDLNMLSHTVEEFLKQASRIDILVNCAAVSDLVPFDKVDLSLMERTLRVNLMAPFFLAQAAAKSMISRSTGGRIINITSTNGYMAEALLCPYNASKGGLELITQTLALELAPHGITVNSVAPGLIDTEISVDFPLKTEFWTYAREHIPLGALGRAEDVAHAVCFLACPQAGYITGTRIVVDGGLTSDQFPRTQFYKKA